MTHTFAKEILRAYDIRGTYGENITEKDATLLGLKFATYLKGEGKKTVCLVRDGRIHSLSLFNHLKQSLLSNGINVIDLGLGPSPLMYFALHVLDADAGIVVTASHNPPSDNGFKIALKERPFFGQDLQSLSTLEEKAHEGVPGVSTAKDLSEEYVQRLTKNLHFSDNLKIVWDPGNGATGNILKKLLLKLPGQHIVIHEEIDGTFPSRPSDPTSSKNLKTLSQTLLENKASLGIAFDGDGDRIGVIDNNGQYISGDLLLFVLAKDMLQRHPHATILTDVKSSLALYEEIEKLGGNIIMTQTGHSFIKAKMKETNALLAGEMSGHVFFADDYYGYDDALYAALRVLSLLNGSKQIISDFTKEFPRYSYEEKKLFCSDETKFLIIDELKKILDKNDIKYNDLDGVRYQDNQGWWLIRASNTQPYLIICYESKDAKMMSFYLSQLHDFLAQTIINKDNLKELINP